MKKLLKAILPPFVGFTLYFLIIRYSGDYFKLKFSEIGTQGFTGLVAYYRYALPLLFTVAVLTQLLIIVPIFHRLKGKSATRKVWAFGLFVFVCLLLATAISYCIWDHSTGINHLISMFIFMSAVQLIYWAINLVVLVLID